MADITTAGLEVWGVIWEDAHYNSGECEAADINHHPMTYVTVGIVVKHDETGVTFASDRSESGTYRCFNFIPKLMIVKEWKIGPLTPKLSRPRRPKPEPIPP